MRQGTAAAAVLLAAGCAAPAPPPTPVVLSTQNPGANIAPIVDFFRRTCLAAPADDREMNAAIAASGWPLRQVHAQDWEGPSTWQFENGQLLWFHIRSMNACLLNLDSLVSPTPAALAAALRPVVQRPGLLVIPDDEAESSWAWPSDPGYRMVLKIRVDPPGPGRTRGPGRQAITLSFAREPMSAAGQNRE